MAALRLARAARAAGSLWRRSARQGLVWLAFADLGVAVPTIGDDLGGDLSALSWANNAFSLVTGALVIAAGRFGDLFGRRRMLEPASCCSAPSRSWQPSLRASACSSPAAG